MIGFCSDWSIKDGRVMGRALSMAVRVKAMKEIYTAVLTGLSSNGDGIKVINYLIENQIFFDPAFISDEEVSDKTYTKLDLPTVIETLSINTDLNIIYITKETLKERELIKLIASAISECDHELKVVLENIKDEEVLYLFSSLNPIVLDEGMSDDEIVTLLAALA